MFRHSLSMLAYAAAFFAQVPTGIIPVRQQALPPLRIKSKYSTRRTSSLRYTGSGIERKLSRARAGAGYFSTGGLNFGWRP